MLPRLSLLSRQLPRTAFHRTMSSIPTKQRAVQIQSQGGLEVLKVREVDVPVPGKGQVVYKVEWAG